MKISISVNHKSIQDKLKKSLLSTKVEKLAYNRAYNHFYRAKNALLTEFDYHPVTAELLMGPKGVNLTNSLDGYGNLFSFIGFNKDDKPTDNLRQYLAQSIRFTRTSYVNGSYYFRVSVPTLKDVHGVTPIPWEDGSTSWVEAVEEGLDSAPQYMFKQWQKSRSSMGLQLPNDIENNEDLQQSPVKYMSELLNNFRNRMNSQR